MRRAARIDSTQPEIVKAIRKIGGEVTHLHAAGQGIADIAVSYRQKWFFFELKSPGGKQNPDQLAWAAKQRAPVYVISSPLEAIRFLQDVKP